MPTNVDEVRTIVVNAKLAAYAYLRNPDGLPGDWAPSSELSAHLRTALSLPRESGVDSGFGTLVDDRSGLVATILVSPTAKEVVVAFGGTTSGRVAGGALDRVFGNVAMSITQWASNVSAGWGRLPRNYAQAAQLLGVLGGMLEQAPWQGYTLRAVGHSKGAGEATYAALAQSTPLRADVFAPAHLSVGLIERLPAANVRRAVDLVRAYSVGSDLVPLIRNVPGLGIQGLGTEHFFPADYSKGRSFIHVHDKFVEHLESQLALAETASQHG
jgi:hypothetical protein